MTRFTIATLFVALAQPLAAPAHAAIQILHTFTSGAIDGANPMGLLLDGSTLYGTTHTGGLPNAGTIYRMNTDGTGFNLLHSFSGVGIDGQNPRGNLTLDGTTLYGTTGSIGGSVFKIETNGSNFAKLHHFNSSPQTSPQHPVTGIALSGSTLYGTTAGGGSHADLLGSGGTIFSLATTGTAFTLIHEFDPGTSGGFHPRTPLTISGQTMYGMTLASSQDHSGVIFTINTTGTGFTVLHEFRESPPFLPVDGEHPDASGLLLIGNRLYGVTTQGGYNPGDGSSNHGVVFGIDTDGNNFDVLYSFHGGTDGHHPMGSLAFDGTSIFGVTRAGGVHNGGTIYKINLDGTGYEKLHDFAGGAADGRLPDDAGLILAGNKLYGTTLAGGQFDIGVVYTFTLVPEPATTVLLVLGGMALLGFSRQRH